MTRRDSITLDLDKQSVEVATGFGGVGVFLTVIGARKNRIITVALPRGKADELARLLRMAAQASRFAQERRDMPDNLTSTVPTTGAVR